MVSLTISCRVRTAPGRHGRRVDLDGDHRLPVVEEVDVAGGVEQGAVDGGDAVRRGTSREEPLHVDRRSRQALRRGVVEGARHPLGRRRGDLLHLDEALLGDGVVRWHGAWVAGPARPGDDGHGDGEHQHGPHGECHVVGSVEGAGAFQKPRNRNPRRGDRVPRAWPNQRRTGRHRHTRGC
jgi:hypothetical protein